MLTPAAALDRLDHALATAKAAGADAADAVYVGDGSTSVSVRLGKLEDIGRSEGEEVGLRVFIGQRVASVSSSDLSPAALAVAAERAVAMAREATEDKWAGLAPSDRLLTGTPPELDIDDGGDPAAENLRDMALAAEDAARAVPGVTNSEGGGAAAGPGGNRHRHVRRLSRRQAVDELQRVGKRAGGRGQRHAARLCLPHGTSLR